jgi:hypothetical protein
MTGTHLAITIAHALVGWALYGATMGIGLAKTTLKRALIIHAVAAPIIFGVISYLYFSRFVYTTPLAAALIWRFIGEVLLIVPDILATRDSAWISSTFSVIKHV